MKPVLVFLLPVLAVISTSTTDQQWTQFKTTHGKIYKNRLEEVQRRSIFEINLQKIQQHNELYAQGKSSYTMAVNNFADLTTEEFLSLLKRHEQNVHGVAKMQGLGDLPDEVDWREAGAVTGVRNQGACGSSWLYGLVGGLEGANFVKINELIPLSVQELIDCASEGGCTGGSADEALEYILANGLTSEANYPADDESGECKRGDLPSEITVKDFVKIVNKDETGLQEAVATIGPIWVNVDASNWQFYASGIFNDPACSQDLLNHGVLTAGYGGPADGAFWLVKNSWGPMWGEQGYIRIARFQENMCGIASDATYPVLV